MPRVVPAAADLVGVIQAGLQSGRLKIVPSLLLAGTLQQELLSFKVKITQAANETFGVWRDGLHDDLVLACALAAWVGDQRLGKASWGPDPLIAKFGDGWWNQGPNWRG